MEKMKFSIEIDASKEMVWRTLWEDATFRDWADIIDEGMYIDGDLKEGNTIQFRSSVNGYGVSSLVEQFTPNDRASFRHSSDTQENGTKERDNEWTGGTESYTLTGDKMTVLTIESDIPPEQKATFTIRMPKALERIKTLAEMRQ